MGFSGNKVFFCRQVLGRMPLSARIVCFNLTKKDYEWIKCDKKNYDYRDV